MLGLADEEQERDSAASMLRCCEEHRSKAVVLPLAGPLETFSRRSSRPKLQGMAQISLLEGGGSSS